MNARNKARQIPTLSAHDLTRFEARRGTPNADGCTTWQGGIGKGGYGIFRDSTGRTMNAHRVSVFLARGPLDLELQLDHLCRVKSCINPAHLEEVTPAVNNARSNSAAAINLRKIDCKRGHELELAPTPSTPTRRICRPCIKAAVKVNRETEGLAPAEFEAAVWTVADELAERYAARRLAAYYAARAAA